MSPSARAMLRLIRGYQAFRAGRPTGCRFYPSCSEYAAEAVATHGAAAGLLISAKRISRCHPLGGRGFDPVPE